MKKILILIILVSALLRLYRIQDYMEFLGDQGRDVVIVSNFLKNKDLIFIGPQTSIGNMYLGPWYYYLIAPSLFLANFSPVGPAIFVALLGILTTYLIYSYSLEWFGSKLASLISAATFAISPVMIKYTSFSWNPNIMPLFSLTFIYYIDKYLNTRRIQDLVLATLSFCLVLNSHYLGLVLLIVPILTIFIQNIRLKSLSLRHIFVAFLILLACFSPLVLFDIKHHGQNFQAVSKFFSVRQETINLKPYKAIPGLVPLHLQISQDLLSAKNTQFTIIFALVFFLGTLLLFRSKNKIGKILSITYLVSLVALALYKQHIYTHYFGFLFPICCIAFGLAISKLKYIGWLVFALFVYISVTNSPLRQEPNRQLAIVDQISQEITHDSNSKPFNIALLSKNNYDPPYRYILDQKSNNLYPIDQNKTSQLYVICEEKDCKPLGNPEYNVAAFGIASIAKQWEVSGIKVYKLIQSN